VRSGFQFRRCAQKLFGAGLPGLHQHQAKIQVGFENPGLGRDRLAVGGNRVFGLAQRVVEKSQVKPGGKVVGILCHHLSQQRFGGGVVLLFDSALGLYEFRWGRRVVNGDFMVTDGLAALSIGGKGKKHKQHDHT